MDQYVLKAGQPLTTQLDEALAKSASVVMVWSSATEDSEWCKKVYESFKTRQSNDPSFRFVLVKLDTVQLPFFMQAKLWLDFSDAREGPRGAGLLRLLYGLQGKPLPPEALKLAAQVDEEVKKALAAIRAAKQNGDVEKLVELGKNESMAWNTSPQLFSEVAEALIALKKEEAALAVLDRTEQLFPRSLRPRQLRGLALARLKKWKEAQQILGELYEAGERDPETLGIYARTWMNRYQETGESHSFAQIPRSLCRGIQFRAAGLLHRHQRCLQKCIPGGTGRGSQIRAPCRSLGWHDGKTGRLLAHRDRGRSPTHTAQFRCGGQALRRCRRHESV